MSGPLFVELGVGFELALARHFPDMEDASGHPPSADTFLDLDLGRVVETFMHRWDDLNTVVGTEGRKRFAVIACHSVRAVVVHGHLGDDDTIELIDIEPDLTPFSEGD